MVRFKMLRYSKMVVSFNMFHPAMLPLSAGCPFRVNQRARGVRYTWGTAKTNFLESVGGRALADDA